MTPSTPEFTLRITGFRPGDRIKVASSEGTLVEVTLVPEPVEQEEKREVGCLHLFRIDGYELVSSPLPNILLYGLPYSRGGLPQELPGLVTPPLRPPSEVAVCLDCKAPIVWGRQDRIWTVWGPVEPVDGRRRTTYVRSQAWVGSR